MGIRTSKKGTSATEPNPSELPSSLPIQKSFLSRAVIPGLLFFGGLIVSLFTIEIAYRVFFAGKPSAVFTSDRPKFFYLKEHSRDKPSLTASPKPAGTFRILVLGDSFTFGQGNQPDETFPSQLERRLNLNESQERIEVINWGVRGNSTSQEIELLKKAIPLLTPDLVILEITLNDPELEPYRVTHRWLDDHGRVVLHSPIFRVWKSLAFVVERILNTQTHRDYINYYKDLYANPQTRAHFETGLRTFKSVTDEAHIASFAVLFPLFSHPLNQDYPFLAIHRQIDQNLKDLQIKYVDLFNRFRGMSPERLQVEPHYDSHPNEIAHRIAADAILRSLVRYRLVPEESIPKNIVYSR
jgi:lysophospholipase L1-like esterase